jgi:polyisoprenoid-binding protein YceI
MNKFLLVLILCLTTPLCKAQKYFTRSGNTAFKGSKDVFEPVEATNKSTTVIFNIETNEVVAQVFMAAFEFKNALMQEHFNENYIESDVFPKGVFKGELEAFSLNKHINIDTFQLQGSLTIRDIEKPIATKVVIKNESDKLNVKASFWIKPEDFDINIPVIVKDKIASEIEILLNYELHEKK